MSGRGANGTDGAGEELKTHDDRAQRRVLYAGARWAVDIEQAAPQLEPEARAKLVGQVNVVRDPPLIMASEDFSFMLERVPGCYFNIGNVDVDGEVHNPGYDFNDDALTLGASAFARLVEIRLARST